MLPRIITFNGMTPCYWVRPSKIGDNTATMAYECPPSSGQAPSENEFGVRDDLTQDTAARLRVSAQEFTPAEAAHAVPILRPSASHFIPSDFGGSDGLPRGSAPGKTVSAQETAASLCVSAREFVPPESVDNAASLRPLASEFIPSDFGGRDDLSKCAALGKTDFAQDTAARLRVSAQEFVPIEAVDNAASLRPLAGEFVPSSAHDTAASSAKDSTPSYSPAKAIHAQPSEGELIPAAPIGDLVQPLSACVVDSGPAPPLCHYFQQGACPKGLQCPFSHHTPSPGNFVPSASLVGAPQQPLEPEAGCKPATPLCRFFQQGGCRKGLECPFSHDTAAALSSTMALKDNSEVSGNDEFVIENGIKCRFGPGAEVVQLQLGSDGGAQVHLKRRCVSVNGLSCDISNVDVQVRLSRYGSITSMRRVPRGAAFAFVTFESDESVDAAIKALNGSSVNSWIGHAAPDARKKNFKSGKGPVLPGCVSVARVASSRAIVAKDVTVKVQWYAPSRTARAYFHQRRVAVTTASKCNGKVLDGRTVTAKFESPSYYHRGSFSVWIGGLGEHIHQKKLFSFINKYAGVRPSRISLSDSSYRDRDGASVVQRLLASQGPLTYFEPSEQRHDSLKRRALAKYANAEYAERACQTFESQHRVDKLGGSKLFVQRIFTAKFTLPTHPLFCLLQDQVITVVSEMDDVRYSIFKNATSSLSLQADEPGAVSKAKSKLNPLVAGEVVMDPSGRPASFWNDYFSSFEFSKKLRAINSREKVYVLCDKRRRQLRIFGTSKADKEEAKNDILQSIEEIHAVPIGRREYDLLLSNGRPLLNKVIQASFARSVSLDLKNRALLVHGDRNDAQRAVAYIAHAARVDQRKVQASVETEEALCPVCFCPPGDDNDGNIVQLGCSHSYCRECFQAWLTGGRMCQFPLSCIADGCPRLIPIEELSRLLARSEFLSLLRSAVDGHVKANLKTFQFCVVPSCEGIYSIGGEEQSRLSRYSTCETVICVECRVEEHEGLSCDQYKMSKLPPNRLRNKVVEEILTLTCPRCSQAFLDFDGCFALKCSSCPCGFCGWCLSDCGGDAHSHVAACTFKPPGADQYFGTRKQFEEAQRTRMTRELIAFLRKLDDNDRQSTLKSIQADLKFLHIKVTSDMLR